MKYIFLVISLVSSICVSAQKQMLVHLKDGSVVKYMMSDVDYVELQGDDESTKPDDSVVGTVGDAVDIGLSIKWASHNYGASFCTEIGTRNTYADACLAGANWGDGWRLPSSEEWQELYEKCVWEWVSRDGICGRRVTGPNGNSIFFPATGIGFENMSYEIGAIGIYWTDKKNGESAEGSYFDSANIYRLDFSCTSIFSVRLVKK